MTPQQISSIVRRERNDDVPAISHINIAAFGRGDEANLVQALRTEGEVLLSLVAEVDSVIAGHILFSRMWIDNPQKSTPAVALGPMAVLPGFQNRGIGSALVQRGLELLQTMSEKVVLVLGHVHFYRRFGFTSENTDSLQTPFPPEAFMALELRSGALNGIAGKVRYAKSFGL